MFSLDLGAQRRSARHLQTYDGRGDGLVGYRAADLKPVASVGSSPILTTLIDFLAGTGLGTTIAHVVIDAGAWRLRRFGFLFERASGRSRGVVSQAFSR